MSIDIDRFPMTSQTYASIARRKDAGIAPWQFAETNPGYVWLLQQQEAFLAEDMARDPTLTSSAVTAGSVSSSKSFREGTVKARVDIIEDAIAIYKNGETAMPSRTIGVFGLHNP